jgi:hypothetical protein
MTRISLLVAFLLITTNVFAKDKTNVVLMLVDNLGWEA